MLKSFINSFLKFTPYQVINKKYLVQKFQIAEATEFENELCNICHEYTVTPLVRRWALIQAIKAVYSQNLEGDIVECGVWKGGNLILSQMLVEKFNLNRKTYGYDTFKGMSKPGDLDSHRITGELAKAKWKNNNVEDYNTWCYASVEEVQTNIKKHVMNPDNVQLIMGKVEDTLLKKENLPESISVLRLDTDWYESTKIELQVLYPRLVKGGILIVDDYGLWNGSRRAVDEYFKDSNVWLHYIDEDCRLLIK